MPRRWRDRTVPTDLRIVVGMRIDKARRHHQPVRVDGAPGALRHLADVGHAAVLNRDIGLVPLLAGAIDHGAVLDHKIVGHRFLPRNVAQATTFLVC